MANLYSAETWSIRSHFTFRWKVKRSEILLRFIAKPLQQENNTKYEQRKIPWTL